MPYSFKPAAYASPRKKEMIVAVFKTPVLPEKVTTCDLG
jgi:hypothetical protein